MNQPDLYRNINELEQIDKKVNITDSDYKAEVVAAEIIEKGYNPDQILIIRDSAARRGYAKDIEDISLQFSQHDLLDYLYIHTNKESIYDILPEGLFHQPVKRKLEKDKEEILDEIKIHRNEEFFARKFFRLFEMEVDRCLVDAYLYEAKFEKKISNPHLVSIFNPYWPILKLLNKEQAIRFLHIIPILHLIRNECKEVAEAIAMVLDVPIKIVPIKLPAKDASSFFESIIGENYLGVDWVLGKSFDDGVYDLKMTIGPISSKKMEFFLETNVGYTILDILCQLFFRGDIYIIKDFKISSEDAAFILSGEDQVSYLGINTFI